MSQQKLSQLKQKGLFKRRFKVFLAYFVKVLRIALILLFLPIFVSFVFLDLWLDTPSIADSLSSKENNGSLIVDKNTNQVIASYPGQSKYESVSIYKMPENLIKAVLTLEDKNFFDNPAGIPWTSLVKVNVDCATSSSDQCRGGSGIIQQLVKNTKADDSRTINRKVTELFLSLKLSQNVSKQRVLEAYLNNVYYGQNSYGVETASKTFFGHSVIATDSDGKFFLSDTKACFLASLLQSPDGYSQSLFVNNNPDTRFADRINFCKKNISQADLSYFQAVGKTPTYFESVAVEDLFSQVKYRLSGKTENFNSDSISNAQIIAAKADNLILEDYSQSLLRSKNWIFYVDYDKSQSIDKNLEIKISRQDLQNCQNPDCQNSQTDTPSLSSFRLLSWSRFFKYTGWFLIALGVIYLYQLLLKILYLKLAPKSWSVNLKPSLISRIYDRIKNLLIFAKHLFTSRR
ncbi:MAG: transglycosylase domain-containing protein [bacterium]